MHTERIYRKMGYEIDQEGIIRRYINEEGNWDEHLLSTKEFIKKCIAGDKPQVVAVLGSGWLLDVPVEWLSENCEKILLYDIRHPRQVIHRCRYLRNVQFLTADITGGLANSVFEIMKKPKTAQAELEKLQVKAFRFPQPVDYVISVNLLCQLDILLIEYLRKFKDSISAIDFRNFRKKIQEAHLSLFAGSEGCLIFDFEEIVMDRFDQLIETNKHLYVDLPEHKYSEEWIWKFDTQMTYYPNRKTHLRVKAIQI